MVLLKLLILVRACLPTLPLLLVDTTACLLLYPMICADYAEVGRMVETDPWTQQKPPGGILAVPFYGGKGGYWSPEQQDLVLKKQELSSEDYVMYKAGRWMTRATCDLWQSGLITLELHAQLFSDKSKADVDACSAVQRCVNRQPESSVRAFSPQELTKWLGDINLARLEESSGDIDAAEKLKLSPDMVSNLLERGVTGDQFLGLFFNEKLLRADGVKKKRDEVIKLKPKQVPHITDTILRHVSRENATLDAATGDVLMGILARDVKLGIRAPPTF